MVKLPAKVPGIRFCQEPGFGRGVLDRELGGVCSNEARYELPVGDAT